jgi:hypothetical protein
MIKPPGSAMTPLVDAEAPDICIYIEGDPGCRTPLPLVRDRMCIHDP